MTETFTNDQHSLGFLLFVKSSLSTLDPNPFIIQSLTLLLGV